jgi:hypothetical protein
LALLCCAVLTALACTPARPAAAWREIPGSPLTPREATLGLWTGREVLLIGGSDEPACPPTASCASDPTPLKDGVALDPGSGRWRRLAEAPAPLLNAQGVVVGSIAYVLPGAGRELLAYDIDGDRWRLLPATFATNGRYALVAAGDRLVAYQRGDEAGPGADYVLDPETATWAPLPTDPLGAAFDRTMAWTGRELVVFDHELTPSPGADRPAVTRAAVLDWATRSWRRLPDSTMLATRPWIMAGGKLVNPTLGGADGGQVGNWGRSYPYGGSVDLAAGTWSTLPNAPASAAESAGAHTDTTAEYTAASGWVLDTATGSWQQVPALPDGHVTGRTVVAAGAEMLIFGGARWNRPRTSATLVSHTWIWKP